MGQGQREVVVGCRVHEVVRLLQRDGHLLLVTATAFWPQSPLREASPELKNVARLPATAVTTKIAHSSRATSTTFPALVTGLGIEEETVSSCTAVKKAASPRPWMALPFSPASVSQTSTL